MQNWRAGKLFLLVQQLHNARLQRINKQIAILRGYHVDVFILAPISSPGVDNCRRRSRGLMSTDGLI